MNIPQPGITDGTSIESFYREGSKHPYLVKYKPSGAWIEYARDDEGNELHRVTHTQDWIKQYENGKLTFEENVHTGEYTKYEYGSKSDYIEDEIRAFYYELAEKRRLEEFGSTVQGPSLGDDFSDGFKVGVDEAIADIDVNNTEVTDSLDSLCPTQQIHAWLKLFNSSDEVPRMSLSSGLELLGVEYENGSWVKFRWSSPSHLDSIKDSNGGWLVNDEIGGKLVTFTSYDD